MRGKVSFGVVEDILDRITPAYAGKRRCHTPALSQAQGSPPPMRGKVKDTNAVYSKQRITPAYAGKS